MEEPAGVPLMGRSATGYVHAMFDKGQDFPTFALSCARAFGALVMMRDDPMDADIPDEFPPTPFYAENVAKAMADLEEWRAKTDEERLAWARASIDEEIAANQSWIDEDDADAKVILAMSEKVEAWTPPTPDHAGLKKFMLDQLTQSMGSGKYFADQITKLKLEAPEDRAGDREAVLMDRLEYSQKSYNEDIARSAERTAWVRALRGSLPKVSPQPAEKSPEWLPEAP